MRVYAAPTAGDVTRIFYLSCLYPPTYAVGMYLEIYIWYSLFLPPASFDYTALARTMAA